ncbi:unnamed protein product [Urochloa humidicola]
MNSSANHQWVAELVDDNEDLGKLDFIDPLVMQQLTESLADELWEKPTEELQGFPTATGESGDDSVFSFIDAKSKQLSFTREPNQEGNATSSTDAGRFGAPSPATMETKGRRRASSGVPDEHAISERKRREKMHLQFATLASIIPDITKADKVSLLGSTIEYVHHLEGRLKALQDEHHRSSGSTAESPPLDARCCIGSEDDGVASPKIEADVRGRTVLLRVVCREKKGVLIMVLKELEKHGLSIINTNVLPLAESSSASLNITVTAQIEDGSCTAVELANNLNCALKKF